MMMFVYVAFSTFVFGWVSAYSFGFHEYIRAVLCLLMGLWGVGVVVEQLARAIGRRGG